MVNCQQAGDWQLVSTFKKGSGKCTALKFLGSERGDTFALLSSHATDYGDEETQATLLHYDLKRGMVKILPAHFKLKPRQGRALHLAI
jgi:hypothetical protein